MCCRLIEAGRKVYIMEGVYVYHWYRGNRLGLAYDLKESHAHPHHLRPPHTFRTTIVEK